MVQLGLGDVKRPMRRRHSRRVRRLNAPRDIRAALVFDQGDVILALQVELELRAVVEVATQPNRSVGGNRAAAVQSVGDAARRNSKVER